VEHERWGTPVASYVAGLPPDARPLDRGKPRDEDTEGGSQLINRRLSLHSLPCAAMAFLADGELAEQALNHASPLDREHKRLMHHDQQNRQRFTLFEAIIASLPKAREKVAGFRWLVAIWSFGAGALEPRTAAARICDKFREIWRAFRDGRANPNSLRRSFWNRGHHLDRAARTAR
jgi:hypothetical protein